MNSHLFEPDDAGMIAVDRDNHRIIWMTELGEEVKTWPVDSAQAAGQLLDTLFAAGPNERPSVSSASVCLARIDIARWSRSEAPAVV